MAGNPMGLILSSNGPNLPSEILVSCRPVLFPAFTLYISAADLGRIFGEHLARPLPDPTSGVEDPHRIHPKVV